MSLPANRAELSTEERKRRRLVKQQTDNSHTVICNANKGAVTMAAVLGHGAGASFTITNSRAHADSEIYVSAKSTTTTVAASRVPVTCQVESSTAGSFVVHVFNGDAADTIAAPVISFRIADAV